MVASGAPPDAVLFTGNWTVGAPHPQFVTALGAQWLRAALDSVLAGEAVARPETPARGCSVKWRE